MSDLPQGLSFAKLQAWGVSNLIKFHESFAKTIHFLAIDYFKSLSQFRAFTAGASSQGNADRPRQRTVGGGDNVIKELSGAYRATPALHIVHGTGCGLNRVIHCSDKR